MGILPKTFFLMQKILNFSCRKGMMEGNKKRKEGVKGDCLLGPSSSAILTSVMVHVKILMFFEVF